MQIFFAIIIGIATSLIAWWVVNILFLPKLEVSELRFNNEKKPFLKIWNKSWHGSYIYEVKCYITYFLDPSRKICYKREDTMKPLLPRGSENKNYAIVRLGGEKCLENFFNDGNKLRITIIGQNRFGVKQVHQREIIVENIPIDDDNN